MITNDGLVTVASARWGTFLQCVPADHLKEVGQIAQNGADPLSGFDHLAFFRAVVSRIRAQGL
jgi:triacylglycerol lipase